ncbi:hypothetical protein CVT24_009474 [Panaeolus cyanescens]|uniref:Uncharacterized protein n=1 Tax=Panaeolus cyanescens TaxID=181874 RepID=A0A409X8X8_9AGAR|nr:hypothetical protein CVT24_009474 [Panaeolus cyanescens]
MQNSPNDHFLPSAEEVVARNSQHSCINSVLLSNTLDPSTQRITVPEIYDQENCIHIVESGCIGCLSDLQLEIREKDAKIEYLKSLVKNLEDDIGPLLAEVAEKRKMLPPWVQQVDEAYLQVRDRAKQIQEIKSFLIHGINTHFGSSQFDNVDASAPQRSALSPQ